MTCKNTALQAIMLIWIAALTGCMAPVAGAHSTATPLPSIDETKGTSASKASDIDYSLFVFDISALLERSGSEGNERPEISHDKVIQDAIAVFNERLFSDENSFWPDWKTKNLQVLITNTVSQEAWLLNNQNAQVAPLGSMREFEWSELPEGDFRNPSNSFGRVSLFGHDTLYVVADPLPIPFDSQEAALEHFLGFVAHEGAHVIFQDDNPNTDEISSTSEARGDRFPIDFATRRYRNLMFFHLQQSLIAQEIAEKRKHLRHMTYFYEMYLAQAPHNEATKSLDYAEGMATYIEFAFQELAKAPASDAEMHQNAAFALLARRQSEGEPFRTIPVAAEAYDIGGMAYAAAIQAGETDIFHSTVSPFTFIAERYEALPIAAESSVVAAVDAHFGALEGDWKIKLADVERAMNDPNNILLVVDRPRHSGMSMWTNPIVFKYDSRPAVFQIRTQELEIGKSMLRLEQKSVAMFRNASPEQLSASQLPSEALVIPIHQDSVNIDGSTLSINTARVSLNPTPFVRNGRYLIVNGLDQDTPL